MPTPTIIPKAFYERQAGSLPGLLGIEFDEIVEGAITMSMEVQGRHMSPNGFLHAASVVALADSAAGYGCEAHLPHGAIGFTTIELKTNFLGTAKSGRIVAKASLMHGGRTTQVWDTVIRDAAGKTIALFRCTQAVLWPRS
jgi:1,4-dihydroxy-2-naphthoyl-CoA hydrolase